MTDMTLTQFLSLNAHIESVRVAMLEALEIPRNRWSPWHFLTIKPDTWHIAHPITCNLNDCEFDRVAQDFSPGEFRVWTYIWQDPYQDPIPATPFDVNLYDS